MRKLFVAVALVAVGATGCWQSTLEAATHHKDAVVTVAPITVNQNPNLEVAVEAVLSDPNATVVVVSVTNKDTKRTAVWVPISVKLTDAAGKVVASNIAGGNDETLTHFPSLPPDSTAYYVDDQFPAGLGATGATVKLGGQLQQLSQALPSITVSGVKVSDQAGLMQFTGTVTNTSKVTQPVLIVQAIARKGNTIVAAGTSVVRDLAPGAKASFLGFFIGSPKGAKVEVVAPATATS